MTSYSWCALPGSREGRTIRWLTVEEHALFADQSHSIRDNLVALLSHSRAGNCSAETVRAAPVFAITRSGDTLTLKNEKQKGDEVAPILDGAGPRQIT